jgi:hypothetical protein
VISALRPCDNPFASSRIDRLKLRPQGFSLEGLIGRLESQSWRGAIVGPRGSGKSTLLEELAGRVGGALVHVPGNGRPARAGKLVGSVGPGGLLLLDSSERLSAAGWWSVRLRTRRLRGLVITTHRPGRLPTLVECRTSPQLLMELVGELVPGDVRSLAPLLGPMFDRHNGNLRKCLRELYDVYAGRRGGDGS